MPPKRQPPARKPAKPPAQSPSRPAGLAVDHMQEQEDVKPDPESMQQPADAEPVQRASEPEVVDRLASASPRLRPASPVPVQASAGAEPSSSAAEELPSDPLQDSKPISIASTPAATPNATPAPSSRASATPSVQRLGSLSRPSIGSASSARGSSVRGRGGRPIVQPKFAGRRSATARAEAEKAEQERKRVEQEARAKEEAAKARREGRLRGRGGRGDAGRHRGRGRGGFVGESDRAPVASGPFSSGQVNQADVGKRRAPAASGRGGGSGGGASNSASGIGGGGGGWSGASRTPGTSGGSGGGSGGAFASTRPGVKLEPGTGDVEMLPQPIKTEDGGYISSDDEDVGKGLGKMNIDDLGVIDLTQDDDGEADPLRSFQPVRIKREAHKERVLGLNADGATATEAIDSKEAGDPGGAIASEKKTGKQRAKDVEVTGASEAYHGTFSPSDSEREPTIKPEPMDDDDRPMTPEPVLRTDPMVPQEPPSSPESKRKAKEKLKPRALSGTGAPQRPVYQTQDEVDEWERHQADLTMLYSELGTLSLPPTTTDKDGDAAMTGAAPEQQQPPDKKADKVYLFQFPPVLPDLLPVVVKPDPEASTAGTDGDAMEVDHQPNNASNPVTVSDDPSSGQPRHPKLPSGAVGKLRIHKSGKATLDWGGTSLVMGMGANASFLQDVLVATMPEHKPGVGERKGGGEEEDVGAPGVAMAMGQVKGKFVVTPDWDAILG